MNILGKIQANPLLWISYNPKRDVYSVRYNYRLDGRGCCVDFGSFDNAIDALKLRDHFVSEFFGQVVNYGENGTPNIDKCLDFLNEKRVAGSLYLNDGKVFSSKSGAVLKERIVNGKNGVDISAHTVDGKKKNILLTIDDVSFLKDTGKGLIVLNGKYLHKDNFFRLNNHPAEGVKYKASEVFNKKANFKRKEYLDVSIRLNGKKLHICNTHSIKEYEKVMFDYYYFFKGKFHKKDKRSLNAI